MRGTKSDKKTAQELVPVQFFDDQVFAMLYNGEAKTLTLFPHPKFFPRD